MTRGDILGYTLYVAWHAANAVSNHPAKSLLIAGSLAVGGYFAYHHFSENAYKEPTKLECIVEESAERGDVLFRCGEERYVVKAYREGEGK